jgi:hypothetical protein
MLMMETPASEDALAMLRAAVTKHRAGGEVSTRLQSDWADVADLPTIVVRIGNCVTIKQRGTFREAAEALLPWVSSRAEPA